MPIATGSVLPAYRAQRPRWERSRAFHQNGLRMTALLLGYQDIPSAREFFSKLGFLEEWSVTSPAGELTRSHVRLGDTVLMLDAPGAHGVKGPGEVGGVTHLVVISVGDVDDHWRQSLAAGVPLAGPPYDRPWGREYEITDPEGYVFAFIE